MPIVWFTGLSGSGKSTLARALQTELLSQGVAVEGASIQYLEVFVNAPLDVCRLRLYRQNLPSFTGVDDPYEPPHSPEVECRIDQETVETSMRRVIEALNRVKARPMEA